MTDYYTCDDCGGYTLRCGCAEKANQVRKAEWAAKALEYRSCAQAVQCMIDNCDEEDSDRYALETILKLSWRSIYEAERFSKT